MDDDPFNPTTWVDPPHEFRIYGDNNASVWCVVDEIDYHWAVKWCWAPNKFYHDGRRGKKLYFRRSQSNGQRYLPPLYLHVEIMKRTGILPPSGLHTLVDHGDGNEWNCQRDNLAWATPSMNALNRRR